MSYGDCVEQLTYLLFLKMADERTKPPYNQPSQIPDKYSWSSLLKKSSTTSKRPWNSFGSLRMILSGNISM
jgi:hypothetical protein